MEIAQEGILILTDAAGKNTGDGYLQFVSQENAEQALLKHKESIDKRLACFILQILFTRIF